MKADDGHFPAGVSILPRVHSERAVGLRYGQRALMIGALNPLNFVGTYEHTSGRMTPFQRLSRTAEAFETIFFGTRAEADEVLARVARLHEPVKGEMPSAAGIVPAGTPYSAYDLELMLWTMAVIADSGPYFYELFVGPLSGDEREILWREYVRFAELFGMPRDAAPATHGEFREYFDGFLASDRAHLTEEADRLPHRLRGPDAAGARACQARPRPDHARQPATAGARAVRPRVRLRARGGVQGGARRRPGLPPGDARVDQARLQHGLRDYI